MLEAIGPRDCSACLRDDAVVRGVEDAYHDRVADGADHDGADHEGVDARLVDAVRTGDRRVVGFNDVALRALRNCAVAMRGVIERRRDGDADVVREKSRRAGDAEEEEQIVLRIVTVRSDHDRTPCVLCDSKSLD